MIKGEFPTQFPLKHQAKDVRLACALGKEVCVHAARLPAVLT